MTAEELVIAIVRVAGALPVLRWAFAGGLVAVFTDLSDLFLRNLLDLGGVRNYQALDKWLDQAYQLTFLIVALRWRGTARSVAVALFAFRLAGFALFEATGARVVLLAFPNVFEWWFLFVASLPHWRPHFAFTRRNTALALAGLTALKLLHEYALHGGQWLDGFTAVEALEAIGGWFAAPFG